MFALQKFIFFFDQNLDNFVTLDIFVSWIKFEIENLKASCFARTHKYKHFVWELQNDWYISLSQLAHFLILQLADFCTYNLVDLLLYLIHYTDPPGYSAEEGETTRAAEAVLGLPRVGGKAASGATLSPTCSFRALLPLSNALKGLLYLSAMGLEAPPLAT